MPYNSMLLLLHENLLSCNPFWLTVWQHNMPDAKDITTICVSRPSVTVATITRKCFILKRNKEVWNHIVKDYNREMRHECFVNETSAFPFHRQWTDGTLHRKCRREVEFQIKNCLNEKVNTMVIYVKGLRICKKIEHWVTFSWAKWCRFYHRRLKWQLLL